MQAGSDRTLRAVNEYTATDNGMQTALTRRSPTAMLDSIILESLWSAFLCFTAMITNAFKKTAVGEAIDVLATTIQTTVASFNCHMKSSGACGQ